MKYLAIFIIVIISSCSDQTPTFLEGSWQSNRELTIENFSANDKLIAKKKEYLIKELGKLTIVFKGNKSAIYFEGGYEEGEELEWGDFTILDSSDSSFTLSVTNSQIDRKEFSYNWAGDCFYLNSMEWGYHEYFCRLP